jgi:hypothetical protein
MKTHRLIAVLFAASLGSGFAAELSRTPSPTTTPTPTPKSPAPETMGACRYNSWNPELYGFYGTKEAVVGKLAKIPETAPFSERRVFVQVTQGKSGIEIKLFERQDGGKVTVTVWTKTSKETSHLVCDLDERIMDNKGLNCVGQKVKEALDKLLGKGNETESLAGLDSPATAFSPSVNAASGEYVKTLVWLLC